MYNNNNSLCVHYISYKSYPAYQSQTATRCPAVSGEKCMKKYIQETPRPAQNPYYDDDIMI